MAQCPLLIIAREMFFAGLKDTEEGMYPTDCKQEGCQWWDRGMYDTYTEGCGIIPRENRRA